MRRENEICPPPGGQCLLAGKRNLPAPATGRRRASSRLGFTLLELLIVMVLIGILASMANPRLQRALERARVARAIGDLNAIESEILTYEAGEGRYPLTLADIGRSLLADPWGHTYKYVPIRGYSGAGARTDRFNVQANSDFDLYSMGPDGQTATSLTSGVSQDDVVRANDGGFLGEARNY